MSSTEAPRDPSHKRKPYLPFVRLISGIKTAIIILLLAAIAFFFLPSIGDRKVTVESRTVQIELKNIGELATQSAFYTNVQMIKGSRQLFDVDIPFTQNEYIFSYDGIIKAGIDFAEIKTVHDAEARTLTYNMPAVKILSNEIDRDSLEVYDEVKNIFNPLKMVDVGLSFAEMTKKAEEKAIANGLLENAKQNAELIIRGFLSGLPDLAEYTISFVWP